MKIEAIISHRNEIPANLHRTYYNLRRHGVTVRLIEDEPQRGCGYRRDQGIMESDADIVFLCDAHMRFSDGYFDHVRDHLSRYPQDVTCSRMQSISQKWEPLKGQLYAGAEIELCDESSGGQFIPLAARWRKSSDTGAIGAVMGACYGMTRENYIAMGRPLAMLRAWGCDEEMLSICAHLTGGRTYLVEGIAHHVYAAKKTGGRKLNAEEVNQVWANRLAMLSAIPMKPETSAKLVEWLKRTDYVTRYKDRINEALIERLPDIERIRDRLSECSVTLESYMSEWERGRNKTKPKPEPVKDEPVSSNGKANYGADESNRHCHKCGSRNSNVVNVRKTGRMIIRYRVCCDCGTRRTTKEIFSMS